jgi:hypothetical protein
MQNKVIAQKPLCLRTDDNDDDNKPIAYYMYNQNYFTVLYKKPNNHVNSWEYWHKSKTPQLYRILLKEN